MEKLIKLALFGELAKLMKIQQDIFQIFFQYQDKIKLLEHIREKHLLLLPIPRKKNLEFVIELAANTYTNYSSMKIVLPIQFTKKTNKAVAMDADTITVNNFFGHWITGINIQRYLDDTRILPTNNNVDVYQYSNAQLKYLPEKSVKTI